MSRILFFLIVVFRTRARLQLFLFFDTQLAVELTQVHEAESVQEGPCETQNDQDIADDIDALAAENHGREIGKVYYQADREQDGSKHGKYPRQAYAEEILEHGAVLKCLLPHIIRKNPHDLR